MNRDQSRKLLDWVEIADGEARLEAVSEFGKYVVVLEEGGWNVTLNDAIRVDTLIASLEQAKHAAQADFENRRNGDVEEGGVGFRPISGWLAPVDVYRVLKKYHANGYLDGDHLSVLSREIAALTHRCVEAEETRPGWRPMEEVRKEHHYTVIGSYDEGSYEVIQPIYYSTFDRNWRRKLDGVVVPQPKAWMPFPEPRDARH